MTIPWPRKLCGWTPIGCLRSDDAVLAINKGVNDNYEISLSTEKGSASINMLCSSECLVDLGKIISVIQAKTKEKTHTVELYKG